MDKLIIKGGNRLEGNIKVSGSKNAALPILVACILSDTPVKIMNAPNLRDINTVIELMSVLGASFTLDETFSIQVDATSINQFKAPYDLVRKMRASILVLGPLLAKFGKAEVSLPGGCAIGSRPVDLHINALRKMGAIVELENGYINAHVDGRLQGTNIDFDLVTVTGTENVIMAGVLAKGQTIITNAACEPEVSDLANFLNIMGADIKGIGTDTLIINGVDSLKGEEYSVMSDRIEACTYLTAAVLTKGKIKVENISPSIISVVLKEFKKCGAQIQLDDNSVTLEMNTTPIAFDFKTGPYPGIPTDMQAQLMTINTIANGYSEIVENIFENRFMHTQELNRMGAKIKVSGNKARCTGVKSLTGAEVMATDLRASACLILAGLAARGETIINRIYHVDRGYERIEEKLSNIGAKISRE